MVGFLAVLVDMISLATFQRSTNARSKRPHDGDEPPRPLATRR